MIAQRKYINIDFPIADGIDQAMLVCDAATPLAMLSFQCFGLTNARERMLQYVCKQNSDALQNTRFTFLLPIKQVFFGLR